MVIDTGSVLGPDYEHIVPLAPGGTGEVFRAHKRGLNVEVVVKRVKAQYRGRLSETREADILKNLRHQYLPRIYDIIPAADGYLYTVMDYIPGCDLEEYVERYGALPQKLVVKWMRQLCQVIGYLHSQKPAVIHCDLKPQNIRITPGGDICVIDFNTSLLYEDREMQALGATDGYAAPEQYNVPPAALASLPADRRECWLRWSAAAAAYGKVTEATDQYGMGAVAYFMLTGYPPGHCLEGVVPLERYQIQVGEALRAVVEKAMALRPQDRFSSAAAMGAALEDLKKTDRAYKRWKLRCQVTAVALGALVLLSAFSLWMGLELRDREQGTAYQELVDQADALIQAQNYEESLEVLSQAMVLDGDRIEAYIRASTVLYRLGRYSECVDLLSGLSFVYDEGSMTQQEFEYAQAELNYVLGSCHYQMEQYSQAVEAFQLAVWFDPNESIYYRDLAAAQAKAGNFNQAQETYQTLQSLPDARREDLLLVQGELAYAQGDYEAALAPLLELTHSGDETLVSRSYLLAAQCYRRLGDRAAEIAVLEEARAVLGAPANHLHTQELIDAYLQAGAEGGGAEDYEAALALCRGLIDQGTATLAVRLNAGLALQYLDRTEEALTLAEETIQLYPNDYRSYLRLALLCLDDQVADHDRAREAYEQAAALYSGAGVQDSEMAYLESLMDSLG